MAQVACLKVMNRDNRPAFLAYTEAFIHLHLPQLQYLIELALVYCDLTS